MAVNCAEIVAEIDEVLLTVVDPCPGATGPGFRSKLAKVRLAARVDARATPGSDLDVFQQSVNFAFHDLLNILTVVERLQWMWTEFEAGRLSEGLYLKFAPVDIDIFHVEMRALFDYLLLAMAPFAKQTLPESFNSVRERCRNDEAYRENTVGQPLANLVLACTWFCYMRDVRNNLVHGGAQTLVFPERGRLLFQLYKPADKGIAFDPVMYNANLADFRIYAGMLVARLLHYVDRWAGAMDAHLRLNNIGDPCICASGVATALDWIKVARPALATASATTRS